MSHLQSPCIRICSIEHGSGLCIGCGRTLAEIAGWMSFSPCERQKIMDGLPNRLSAKRRDGFPVTKQDGA